MRGNKEILALVVCMVTVLFLNAQMQADIKPKSFVLSQRLFNTTAVNEYTFNAAAIAAEDNRTDKGGHMPRFASSIATDISMNNAGTWTTLPNGDRVWQLKLSSTGALALIPCYDQFYLPIGATLHVFNPMRDEVTGAFTNANNPRNGRFCTGLIHGEACIIEYYEPAAVAGQGRIHLNELGHAYRMVPPRKSTQAGGTGFGGSNTCEVNVACPEGQPWQDQKNAIVRILVKTGPSYGWCSGALINNTNQDCTPYILSADHCYQDDISGALPSTADLSQWMFYFNYESPTCANPVSEGTLANNFIVGCTAVAASLDTGGNSGSDFALVKMNSSPPLNYIPYYAGWSNIDVASENGVGIHHPSADIKKISTYLTPLTSTSWAGVAANTHWQILWAPTVSGHGVTEGGSSGSPIFDFNHHIVGTLTGGGSDCSTPNNNDLYGKFSYHWSGNGTTANKRLLDWLDPGITGAQTLDGMYSPCHAYLALDAALTGIDQSGSICDSNIALSGTLTNYGTQTLTQDSIYYTIDGGIPQAILWTGSLASFLSTSISLPAQNFSPGTHTVTITSAAPNAGVDADPANNSRTTVFTVASATAQYTLNLQTGDLGSNISWELTDQNDAVLYSGGPYTDNASGQVVNQSWCLPRGCYKFTVFSANGSGMQGNLVNGTFSIKNIAGTTVAQLQQVNFGAQVTVNVCQGQGVGVSEVTTSLENILVYPNPSAGLFNVDNVQAATQVTVTDALGRIITTQELTGKQTEQINLSGKESGVYFLKFSTANGNALKKIILSSGH